MKAKNLLMIGAGAVVIYYIYQKYNKPTVVVDTPITVDLKDYTQGELFNEKFNANGCSTKAVETPFF